MKIGIMMTGLGVLPGRERNVSGHAQIPLRTVEMLADSGHEVHLIATRHPDGSCWPDCLPTNCELHLVTDGRVRGELGRQNQGNGIRPAKLIRQLWEVRRLVHRLELDVLHLFGFERMARMAGLLKLIPTRCPIVATILGQLPNRSWMSIYRRVDRIVVPTDSLRQAWTRPGLSVVRVAPGVVRDFAAELIEEGLPTKAPHRVLFWREASKLGGGDLCVTAFSRLADEFPEVTFTFAVRQNRDEVQGLEEAAQRFKNIELIRFPYPPGVSLASLIAESRCAVLPFREVSIEPQLAVAETLAAGLPVITSDIHSMPELVQEGVNGFLVPSGNAERVTDVLRNFLNNNSPSIKSKAEGANHFAQHWNWDPYLQSVLRVYHETVPGSAQSRGAA